MSFRARASVAVLCLLGMAVNLAALGPALGYTARGITDFMPLYAAGKLIFTGHLYSVSHGLATQAQFEGWSSVSRPFARLPCFALFYWPLAQLPYRIASAVWELLCAAGIAGFVWLWPARQRSTVILAGCWSLPLWMTIAEGQDIGFVLLAMAGTAFLLRRRHPRAAGAVASLCLVKFHLFLLIPVWIAARRRWRFAAGLAMGGSLLAALSFVAGGLSWPLDYWRLLHQPATSPGSEVMPNLHGLFLGLPHAALFEIAGTLVLAVAVWIASRRPNPSCWGLAAALAGGIVITPHAYMADCALLIPALLSLMPVDQSALRRALYWFLLSPAPWLLLMMGSGFPSRLGLLGLVFTLSYSPDYASISGNCSIKVPVQA